MSDEQAGPAADETGDHWNDAVEARREAVRRTRGLLTGVYPEGYLRELRKDWPA